jgi:hypothetical protein
MEILMPRTNRSPKRARAARSASAWNPDRLACIATWTILGGDKFLDQFDEFFLPIEHAGDIRLTALPYFPKFEAAPFDIDGRADQMARRFFKAVVQTYTRRKENPMDTVEDHILLLRGLFKNSAATFSDLAQATDEFFKFGDE